MSPDVPCIAPPLGGPAEVKQYVSDARWLPHAYDPRADALTFAHLNRAAHRKAPFLHPDHLADVALSPAIPVVDIPSADVRSTAGHVHFIFHTAFCCSTLLARAFDAPGAAMGLNEPNILMHFAKIWSNARRPPGALAALQTSLDLLSRPLARGEAQIIKPSNAANHLIPSILHVRPDAKAVVLSSSLELFLTSVVRRGAEGRLSVRQFLRGFFDTLPFDATVTEEEALLLTDLQAAALAWVMQVGYLSLIVARFGDRLRVLDCNTFLAQPARVLGALAAFFGLAQADWQAVVESPVFKQHSKNIGRPFDAAAHQAQHEEARALYRKELASAWAWGHAIAARANIPFGLTEDVLTA